MPRVPYLGPTRRAASEAVQAPWPERRFGRVLAGICVAALLCRIAILHEFVGSNPISAVPVNDARVYWNWAGQIAAGHPTSDTPFFSAPLYPYLLGALRVLGGSLTTVCVVQSLVVVATAGLLAVVGRRRFGAGAGLLAAGLYLVLLEPASAALRVLPGCLEMALLAALWALLAGVQARPTVARHVAAGASLGALCLAYAPALLLVPVVVAWLVWPLRRRLLGAWPVAILLAIVVAFIAPATLHNWRVQGEFFPVRAGSGVVLRQGNHLDSDGRLTPLPGISGFRDDMFEHAFRQVEDAIGHPPTWKEVDRYFRDQALRYWRAEPLRAFELVATKLYWFVSGRNYDDMYEPRAEITLGLSSMLRLTPLPTPLVIGPALVGLVLLARRPLWHAPELMLAVLPVVVVAVFFYSPRFRLPALPILAVAAAVAVERALQFGRHRGIAAIVALTVAAGVGLGVVNRAVGFDVANLALTCFNAAHGCQRWGDTESAIRWWRRGLDFAPKDVGAWVTLGDQFANMERLEEALAQYEQAHSLVPDDPDVLARMGETLVRLDRSAEAAAVLQRAVALAPNSFDAHYLLGVAHWRLGASGEAGEAFQRALEIEPLSVEAWHDLGRLHLTEGRLDDAAECFGRCLAIDPANGPCRAGLDEASATNPPLAPG